MAQSTLSQRLAFEGLEDITARLKAMGDAGQKSLDQIRTATGDTNAAFAHLSSVVGELQGITRVLGGIEKAGSQGAKGVGELDRAIKGVDFSHTAQDLSLLLRGMDILDSRSIEIGQSLGKLGGVFGGVVGAIGTVVIGLGALSVAAAESIRTLQNQAAAVGLTREEYEGFVFAANQVGVSQETLSRGLDRFAANLGKAKDEQEKLGDAASITAEKNRLAVEKLTIAVEEQDLALERNKDKQLALRDAILSASLAAEKAKDAFEKHSHSLEHAHLSAERAQLQYEKLRDTVHKGTMTAQEAKEAQLDLTEAQLRAKEAQEGIGEAEKKRKEEAAELAKAYEKVQQAIRQFEMAQKEARLEFEKQKLALEEEKLKLEEVGKAAEATKNVFQKFKLNIDADPITVLEDFIDRLSKIPDAAERDRAAVQAFGRSFYELNPLLTKSKEELQALLHQADAYKIVTDEDAKASTKLIAAYDTMKFALEGLKNAIGAIIGTNFVKFFQNIADVIGNNKQDIRDFFIEMSASMARWGDAITNVLSPALNVLWSILKAVGSALSFIKSEFDAVAKAINDTFKTKLTGEDLIVGIIAARVAVSALGAAFAVAAAVAGSLVGTITRIGTAILGLSAATTTGLIPMLAALGPAGWIGLGLIAVSALVITFQGKWGDFFKFFSDGIAIAKGALEAFIDLIQSAIEAFGRLQQRRRGEAETPATPRDASGARIDPNAQPSGPQPGSSASNDFNQRVEQENPQLFAPGHQEGGWIGGSGPGDTVPIMAEPGEHMTRKSMAQRWGGLLEAINSGGLSALSDRMSSILPPPVTVANGGGTEARPRGGTSDQALFHLTIGDKTFRNISAPRDTAESLLQHARHSGLASGGKKQSWYGS
jgi:hypothetical protein